MMNPAYHFARMRELLEEYEPSRERSLAATKLEECELWLAKCQPTQEALGRDQAGAVKTQCPACGQPVTKHRDGRLVAHGNPPCSGSGVTVAGSHE